jgi:predicted short-subunit dehydrogenase-like oxidoreductase (DUF2520 family)
MAVSPGWHCKSATLLYHEGVSQHWLVVGAGRCGLQLARSMLAAGMRPCGLVVRDVGPRSHLKRLVPGVAVVGPGDDLPAGDGMLVAVPDDAIAACARQLAERGGGAFPVAVHTSGLLPAAILAPLRSVGCAVASLHPLVSFPDAVGPLVALDGVTAAVEGEEDARRHAARLAVRLGMVPVALRPDDKPLYHAAAAIAGNLTYTLVVTARELLETVGLDKDAAKGSLAPLVRGSIEAALEADGWERLTGALARADRESVAAHVRALPPRLTALYRAVALQAVARLKAEGTLDNAVATGLVAALTGTR